MKIHSLFKCLKTRLSLLIMLVLVFSILFPQSSMTIRASELCSELKPHCLTTGSQADYNKAQTQQYICDGIRLIPFKMKESGNLFLKIYAGRSGAHPISVYKKKDASDLPVTITCFCEESNSSMYYAEASKYLTKGNYYLQLPEDSYTISSYIYPQASRSLKTNTWMCAYSDYLHPTYFTYKPKSNGYLTLYENALLDTDFSAGVTLCNSKNTPIVNTMSNHDKNDKIVYALKKGVTYKIKIQAIDPNQSHYYRVKAVFTNRTEKSGSKKSNASKLSFGKTGHGMVFAEDSISKADWYKVTNPKTQKVIITYSGSITSGSMKLDVYKSNGTKFGSYAILSSVGESNKYVLVDKNGKTTLPKGTYYFKVTKSRKQASGIYSLKMSTEQK